jgi:predicted enzyme related to lactoylglutathione lyase
MHKVTGIGGFFFRAEDSASIAAWYRDNLGIDPVPTSYGEKSWRQQAGTTVFTAMPEAMDQFDAPGKIWGINFRVDDLDAMVAQLESAGTEVSVDPATYPNGRFASLTDPEGNPIQLWQPSGVDAEG